MATLQPVMEKLNIRRLQDINEPIYHIWVVFSSTTFNNVECLYMNTNRWINFDMREYNNNRYGTT